MQEKESMLVVRCKSRRITVRHHSAGLMMSNSYPRDGFSSRISQPLKILILLNRHVKMFSSVKAVIDIK